MPSKKRPTLPPSREPLSDPIARLEVLLEEMRERIRTTAELAGANHEEMRREVQSFRAEVRGDMSLFRRVIEGNNIDVRDLKTGSARMEGKLDKLVAREERVRALERRGA
jgi:hypothetical protein